MIGKTSIVLKGESIDLDFNMYAYEQLAQLLARYSDYGYHIDLNPSTFENLLLEVQQTSFFLAARMVIYAGICGECLNEGKRPKYDYGQVRDMINGADEKELMEVIKFFWGALVHEQEKTEDVEGEKEKVEQEHISKKKVSPTGKSKRSSSGQSE